MFGKNKPKLFEVEFLVARHVEGKDRKIGDKLEVSKVLADSFVAKNIAKLTTAAAK